MLMRRCAGRSARRSLAPYTTWVRRDLEVRRLRAGVEAGRGSGEGLVPGCAGRAGEHHSQLVRCGRRGDSKEGRGLRLGAAGDRRRRSARGPEREGNAKDRTYLLEGGASCLLG